MSDTWPLLVFISLESVPFVPTVTRTENVPKHLQHFRSVPTFMRTVNGPKNVYTFNGDPSPPCSVKWVVGWKRIYKAVYFRGGWNPDLYKCDKILTLRRTRDINKFLVIISVIVVFQYKYWSPYTYKSCVATCLKT